MSVRIGESWSAGHGRRRWASLGIPWWLIPLCLFWYGLFWLFAAELWLAAETCLLAVSAALAAADVAVAAVRRRRLPGVHLTRIGLGLFTVTAKDRP